MIFQAIGRTNRNIGKEMCNVQQNQRYVKIVITANIFEWYDLAKITSAVYFIVKSIIVARQLLKQLCFKSYVN